MQIREHHNEPTSLPEARMPVASPQCRRSFLKELAATLTVAHEAWADTEPVTARNEEVPSLLEFNDNGEVLPIPGCGYLTPNTPASVLRAHGRTPPVSATAYIKYYLLEELESGFAKLSRDIEEAKRSGQTLHLRYMVFDNGQDLPKGVPELRALCKGRGFEFTYDDGDFRSATLWVPDFDLPELQRYLSQSLARVRAHLDSRRATPLVEQVDIGLVGEWGEWHLGDAKGGAVRMPSLESSKRLIDLHFEHFPEAQKLAALQWDSYPGAPRRSSAHILRYALSKGAGIRADCLGAPDSNMMRQYGQILKVADGEEQWKYAPVSFEICGTLSQWKKKGWSADEILALALERYHVSSINFKSGDVAHELGAAFARFQRRAGFRLVPRDATWESALRSGAALRVSVNLENRGVAPPYRDYYLALRVVPLEGGEAMVSRSDISLKGALPGAVLHHREIIIRDLPRGSYQLAMAAIGEHGMTPALKFPLHGAQNGWYPLGRVQIR